MDEYDIHDGLRELQQDQRVHDQKYHRDIYEKNVPDRINHHILHFAKYVGRLASIPQTNAMPGLWQTMTDTFIIVLSMADACGYDLGGNARVTPTPTHESIRGLLSQWLWQRMSIATGRMAKIREDYDHGHHDQFPETIQPPLEEIVVSLLTAALILRLDLATAVRARWAEIENARVV